MDEHTRIWAEPLSDSERWIIEDRCVDPSRRDTGKWMRHLLTCYDALAVRAAELERDLEHQRERANANWATAERLEQRAERAETALREAIPYMEKANTNAGPINDWLAQVCDLLRKGEA